MGRCQTKTANKAIVKASPGFAVPFTFDPLLQPQIIVQIRIDGQAPLPFLVDTGLNAGLLINTQATQKLHLQCDTAAPVISIGKIDARRTHLNSVSFLGTANTSLPVDGLFLDVPAHKPMEVVGLLPHCVGEEAGLRTGDTILEFNGLPASEITPAVLAVEFRKPLLTLKVQAPGHWRCHHSYPHSDPQQRDRSRNGTRRSLKADRRANGQAYCRSVTAQPSPIRRQTGETVRFSCLSLYLTTHRM